MASPQNRHHVKYVKYIQECLIQFDAVYSVQKASFSQNINATLGTTTFEF